MARALELARRGDGRTSPNPMVGAVLVRAGRRVGEGYHRACGTDHAERVALRQAGARALGATLYVSLEPCNHHGRTPPCVEAIAAAGVVRVIYAMRDPNPAVAGGGARALRALGIAARLGPLGAEARRLNESFVTHVGSGRPLVLWKTAASLDGRIATASGESRWITGGAARRTAHKLRRWADAVMVGSGTVLADDPRLDVRDAGPAKPVLRVIVDGRLRTPPGAQMLRRSPAGPVLLYADTAAPASRVRALCAAGAKVVPVARADDGIHLDLHAVLADLGARGIGRVLLEGGGELAAAMVRARLVDRFAVFLAPRLLGAAGVPALGPLAAGSLAEAPRLRIESVRAVGRDWLFEGRFEG